MSDLSKSGGELVKANDNKGTALVEAKAIRYHNPYSLNSSVKGRHYANSVVTSQETMLENLRFMKRELEREDRKIARFQQEMLLNQHPRRWRDRNNALE